jgi:putative flippase GtrA
MTPEALPRPPQRASRRAATGRWLVGASELPERQATAWAAESPESRSRFDPIRYGKFLLVGLSGTVVNLVVFVLVVDELSGTSLSNFVSSVLHFASKTAPNPAVYLLGSAVGFFVATLWNFGWNNFWTFRTFREQRYSSPRRLGLYFGVSLGSLAVNEIVLLATQLVLPPLLGQGIGIIAGSVVGFFGNNRYTFAEARRA